MPAGESGLSRGLSLYYAVFCRHLRGRPKAALRLAGAAKSRAGGLGLGSSIMPCPFFCRMSTRATIECWAAVYLLCRRRHAWDFPEIEIKQRSYPKEFLAGLYERMICIREFEERAQDLYNRTTDSRHLPFSCGQEAVAVGVCAALRPDDYITSTHRGHGHCLAKGAEVGKMFAELFGKVDGYCRGKGGSMHIANQDMGNLGANAIVGGGIPIATGAGLSCKLRKTSQVSVCFFGDGALNQGVLLEAMNMASFWRLPVIYVCENNQYGEYTPTSKVTAGNIPAGVRPLGIPSAAVDGMDVLAVYQAAGEVVRPGARRRWTQVLWSSTLIAITVMV